MLVVDSIVGSMAPNGDRGVPELNHSQICEFRASQEYVHMGVEYHVGHVGASEFKDNLNTFLDEHRLTLGDVEVCKKQLRTGLEYTSYVLKDPQIYKAWNDHHAHQCELRMQTAAKNLKKS